MFIKTPCLVAWHTTTDTIVPMEVSASPSIHLSVSIVLHHSSVPLLRRVLASLQRSASVAREAAVLSKVSVALVDNSCEPEYRLQVKEMLAAWPHSDCFCVTYSGQSENRGFGAGHNSVIETLDSNYHLVLNPDAELSDDTLLTGLSTLQTDDSIVLLSPRVWRGEGGQGGQEFLCKCYPSVLALLLRGFAPRFLQRMFRRRLHHYEVRDLCSGEQQADIMLASGCFMLVRTAALRSVGGFNDTYFLYFEDFDLSLRLGSQGRLVFNPAMQIVHHGGYAASKGFAHVKYFVKAGVTFFNQHGWRWI